MFFAVLGQPDAENWTPPVSKLTIINGKFKAEEDEWFLMSFEDWKNRNGNPHYWLTYDYEDVTRIMMSHLFMFMKKKKIM